jgi:hypothetical protein
MAHARLVGATKTLVSLHNIPVFPQKAQKTHFCYEKSNSYVKIMVTFFSY